MKSLPLAFLALCIYACNSSTNPTGKNEEVTTKDTTYEIKTGGAKMIQVDGKYNVWTKKIGDGKIKVLLLHGVPVLHTTTLNVLKIFCPKKELNFTITTSWDVVILTSLLTPLFGIFQDTWKK
jgi:proline iminopeptidase